jgi:restriction system protein
MDVVLAPTERQKDFVSNFIVKASPRTSLVAAPGTGKAVAVLYAAKAMMERDLIDGLLIVSGPSVLRTHWQKSIGGGDGSLDGLISNAVGERNPSITLSPVSLRQFEAQAPTSLFARRWLVVVDDADTMPAQIDGFVNRFLTQNSASRALFVARSTPRDLSVDAEFQFDTEIILGRKILEAPETEIRIARFAPSFSLLRKLQKNPSEWDNLSWREFEILISKLLKEDGYTVELMKGTNDGGVDVIAFKNHGIEGDFKTLWQAKKKGLKNKVGISVVRELADTRNELGASKGIIVTSTFLTRNALARISRDKYILGKVDRHDLDSWIERILRDETK